MYQLPQRLALQPNSFRPELCWAGQQVATIDMPSGFDIGSSFKVVVSEKVILIGLDGESSLRVLMAVAVGGAVNVPLGISTSMVGDHSFSSDVGDRDGVLFSCCELRGWT